jgi:outer membrane lipoprotein SlyB
MDGNTVGWTDGHDVGKAVGGTAGTNDGNIVGALVGNTEDKSVISSDGLEVNHSEGS